MIRIVTNMIWSLLFQDHLQSSFWVEALHVATHLINILSTIGLCSLTPYETLQHCTSDYFTLHVFGCICYPNLAATSTHKLAPRSSPCLFIGYPSNQKWYRCLDIFSGQTHYLPSCSFWQVSLPISSIVYSLLLYFYLGLNSLSLKHSSVYLPHRAIACTTSCVTRTILSFPIFTGCGHLSSNRRQHRLPHPLSTNVRSSSCSSYSHS